MFKTKENYLSSHTILKFSSLNFNGFDLGFNVLLKFSQKYMIAKYCLVFHYETLFFCNEKKKLFKEKKNVTISKQFSMRHSVSVSRTQSVCKIHITVCLYMAITQYSMIIYHSDYRKVHHYALFFI